MRNKNIMDGIVVLIGVFILVFSFVIKMFTELNIIISTIIVIIIFVLLITIYKLINNKLLKKVDLDYIRDIPNRYDLPTVSFLYDNIVKIDPLIAALKLKLKRLEIIDNEEKIINNYNIEKLSNSEKYLFNLLYFNSEEKYSVYGFKEVLHEQLNDANFSDYKSENNKPRFVLYSFLAFGAIIGILCIMGIIKYDTYEKFLAPFAIIWFVTIFIIDMVPEVSQYNKVSKKERKNILSFYMFLKDFSSLDEKEMKEYPLWKEYLEFAVLFGINKKYTIENVNLITTNEFFDKLEELGKDR